MFANKGPKWRKLFLTARKPVLFLPFLLIGTGASPVGKKGINTWNDCVKGWPQAKQPTDVVNSHGGQQQG